MSTRFDVGSATSKLCAHGSRFGSALRAEAPRHPSSSPPGLYFRTTNATGVFWGVVVGTVVGLFIFGNGGFDLLWFTWHIVDIPGWLGGQLQGSVVAFLISTVATVGSTLARPQEFSFETMIRWTREQSTVDHHTSPEEA
ncbi:MAG TPA: hypothetical protein VK059_10005 [Nocardioidaceae bacterium]|nr:hypothetical protein [Nocardioidaceae bacterium]